MIIVACVVPSLHSEVAAERCCLGRHASRIKRAYMPNSREPLQGF